VKTTSLEDEEVSIDQGRLSPEPTIKEEISALGYLSTPIKCIKKR